MSKGLIGCAGIGVVALVVAVVVGMWVAGQYNGFVQIDESVNQAWSEVENTYQRRLDGRHQSLAAADFPVLEPCIRRCRHD